MPADHPRDIFDDFAVSNFSGIGERKFRAEKWLCDHRSRKFICLTRIADKIPFLSFVPPFVRPEILKKSCILD